MKKAKWLTALVAVTVVLAVALTACNSNPNSRGADIFARPGTYVVEAPGMFGTPIISTVTVDSKMILSISTNHNETDGFGDRAIDILTGEILAHQTLAVDRVAGATFSSAAFLSSMNDALLTKAGGNRNMLQTKPRTLPYRDTTANVVVVGSGGAGFAAAIRLAKERPSWKIIMLESKGILGGTSLRASSTVYTSGSRIQVQNGFIGNKPAGVDGGGPILTARDDVRAHGGVDALSGTFVDFFRAKAANSKYLSEYANEVKHSFTSYPYDVYNTISQHRNLYTIDTEGVTAMIAGLEATALKHGVDIRLNNRGRILLNEAGTEARANETIGGIRVELPDGSTYDIKADAVILATGGIEGNQEMKKDYFQKAIDAGANNIQSNILWFATGPASGAHKLGDGHVMAKNVGAALDMMHSVATRNGLVPTAFANMPNANLPHIDNFMSNASPRTNGQIYIHGTTGQRFIAESNNPVDAMFDSNGVPITYYGIMSHAGVRHQNNTWKWANTPGFFQSADTPEELAALFLPAGEARANFVREIKQINHIAAHHTTRADQARAFDAARNCNDANCPFRGDADAVPRANFPANNNFTSYIWGRGPYYLTGVRLVPILHGAYGGIRINNKAQALRGTDSFKIDEETQYPGTLYADSNIIKGLYAAGTCSYAPRGSSADLQSVSTTGIVAANAILGLPTYDNSYWN